MEASIMDQSSSSPSDHSNNFEFAFNSSNFSDRILRIEVMATANENKEDEGCSSLADWVRHRKRRREDAKKEKVAEIDVYKLENTVNCDQPDTDDSVEYENPDAEVVAMIECPTGDEAIQSDSWSMDYSPVLRVKSIYISSAILAAKSPFFYKLFSNGMRESDQRHATLRISDTEEAALMELLGFMYSGKLSNTEASLVLDVLLAADKFEVASCMRYCSQLLRNQQMTPESALLYLDLPCTVSMASAVQPLTDAAKLFLSNKFRDIAKFQTEFLNLPLAAVEAVLSSDNLHVASEDAVFDIVLKWARIYYPKAEDRREILGSRLCRLVRFPYMTCRRLKRVLQCSDLDQEFSSKAVMEALFFKAETPHRQRALALDNNVSSANRKYVERTYKYRPVKVVEFEAPHPQCVVYLNLKKEECANLYPGGRVYSQAFHLGGQGFFLSAHCNLDQQSSFHCFGLFLGMQEKGSVTFTVDYEFSVRTRTAGDFISKYKGYYTFTGGKAVGYRNLFAVNWDSFMGDDSLFFIDGVLHLRAELTIKKPNQQVATVLGSVLAT